MVEFKGMPCSSDRKFDKTGFYILWPLAAFPLVAGPFALITSPAAVFSDLTAAAVMALLGIAWILFWGMMPVLAYQADRRTAMKRSTYRILIDANGVDFHTTEFVRMSWDDMLDISSDSEGDITFKGRNKRFVYDRWLEDDYGFVQQVKSYFPSASIHN